MFHRAKNCQICVGTPGRVKQLISEGLLSVDTVRLAVLDEADKMLESSFISDTTWILNSLPESKQVLALSATYPPSLASLAERFMRSPTHVRPGQTCQVLSGVAQFVLQVNHSPVQQRQNTIKQTALLSLLSCLPYSQCLVFSNYTSIAQATTDFLNSRGFPAIFMSAGQDQARRLAVMETFKQFNCRILCSTDLTARGIDAENVNLVINLEVPWEHNTYLHRIGRGGRFGSHSVAVTLAAEGAELLRLRGIVTKTGSEVRLLEGQEIPRDVRKHMDTMTLLQPAEEQTAETEAKESESVNGEADILLSNFKFYLSFTYLVTGKENSSTTSKPGKVKRRGQKKKKGSQPNEHGDDKSNELEETGEAIKDQLEEDQKLIRSHLETKSSNQLGPIRSWEEISRVAARIEAEKSLEGLVTEEEQEIDGMDRLNSAVGRVAAHRRELFDEKIEAVQSRTASLETRELIQLIMSGSGLPSEPLSEEIEKVESVESVEKSATEAEDDSTESSERSSESDSSDSESQSSDCSDSEESSSDEDQTVRTPGYPPGYPPGYLPCYPPGYPSAYPNPSGDPNILRWYSEWCRGVAQHRQSVQAWEYYSFLQQYPGLQH